MRKYLVLLLLLIPTNQTYSQNKNRDNCCAWICLETLLTEAGYTNASASASTELGVFTIGKDGLGAAWLKKEGVRFSAIAETNYTFDGEIKGRGSIHQYLKNLHRKSLLCIKVQRAGVTVGHAVILVSIDDKIARIIEPYGDGSIESIPVEYVRQHWIGTFVIEPRAK